MKIVDLHCDTISRLSKVGEGLNQNSGQFDLQRAKKSQVQVQFFALYTTPADSNSCLRQVLKQLARFSSELEINENDIYHLTTSKQLTEAMNHDKLGAILHLEGAECLGTDSELLDILYNLGLRSLGLTWNPRNLLADGAGEGPQAGGLSRLGRNVVRKMSKLGIILDLAHISVKSYYDAMECYPGPVLVTHANAKALCPHWRNIDDHQLRALADHGGIIGITQVADFVREGGASMEDLINHVVHIADLVGVEYIGLGSDFDGADDMVINEVTGYLHLADDLAKRGFNSTEVEKILNGNARAIIEQVL